MLKFVVVFSAIVALAIAGGSGDVDEALLARVAQILSENDGGSGGVGGGSGSSLVGDDVFARVSQILAQSESSGSSRAYSPPSSSYGAPSRSSGGSSGGSLSIGRPERAQRVAEFDLSSGGSSGRSSGGYNSGGY